MPLARDAIIYLKDLFFPLYARTGIRFFHDIPNLLWFRYVHGRLPSRRRQDIRDLTFFNKYDVRSIALAPFVDKAIVKHFVKGMAPEIRVPNTYKIARTREELADVSLDHPYVAKPTHGSGVAVVKPGGGALSHDEIEVLGRGLAKNYYLAGGEIQYLHLEKGIIFEEFIGGPPTVPPDFKVYCFEGHPLFCTVLMDRYSGKKQVWLDRDGKRQPMHLRSPWGNKEVHPHEGPFELPETYPRIIAAAEKLSRGFRFVRVDLFTCDGDVYLGELTFTPNNALNVHHPVEVNDVRYWLDEPPPA